MKSRVWTDPRTGTRWVINDDGPRPRVVAFAALCAVIIVGFSWFFYIILNAALGKG